MAIKKKHCRIWKNNKNNQKSALWSERRILSKKKLFYEVNSLGASSCKAGLLSNRGLKFVYNKVQLCLLTWGFEVLPEPGTTHVSLHDVGWNLFFLITVFWFGFLDLSWNSCRPFIFKADFLFCALAHVEFALCVTWYHGSSFNFHRTPASLWAYYLSSKELLQTFLSLALTGYWVCCHLYLWWCIVFPHFITMCFL